MLRYLRNADHLSDLLEELVTAGPISVRKSAHAVAQVCEKPHTGESMAERPGLPWRWLTGAFAGAAVLLAAVGLYGTLGYLTAQRTREFGIRLALGSSVRAIVAIVMREGVVLAAAGVGVGLVGAAACTRAIGDLLYGVRPLDGATLAGVAGIVGVAALAAAGVPAWRAARIDPQASLRSE
jgi:hypothetical protein